MLLAIAFTACASSRQLATRYVVEHTDIHVLILPPGELIKSFAPGHPDDLPSDSILGEEDERARFITEVQDSAFVEAFMYSLRHYLDVLYVNHYGPEDTDSFFELEVPAYIFAVGQLELMEYQDEEVFVARDANQRYRATVDITVLENNVWFEFMKLHDPDHEMQVLFDVRATSDYVDGRFIRGSDGRVRFEPTEYPLSLDDVYELAAFAGKRNAQNIFDHLMNLYVSKQRGRTPDNYFHYDVDEHRLKEREFPPFIRIKPTENDSDGE